MVHSSIKFDVSDPKCVVVRASIILLSMKIINHTMQFHCLVVIVAIVTMNKFNAASPISADFLPTVHGVDMSFLHNGGMPTSYPNQDSSSSSADNSNHHSDKNTSEDSAVTSNDMLQMMLQFPRELIKFHPQRDLMNEST